MSKIKVAQDLIDFFYPVGSYYETSDINFNPNITWGGTWKEDSAGRVLVAYDSTQTEFNTVGKTLGSKYLQSHSHSFSGSIGNAGAHSHDIRYGGPSGSGVNISYSGSGYNTLSIESWAWRQCDWVSNIFASTSGDHTHTISGSIGSSGSGNAQNIQPSVVAKRWHRIA